jgi:hypothetical protein
MRTRAGCRHLDPELANAGWWRSTSRTGPSTHFLSEDNATTADKTPSIRYAKTSNRSLVALQIGQAAGGCWRAQR